MNNDLEQKKTCILTTVRMLYSKFPHLFTDSLEVLEEKALNAFMDKDLSNDQIINELTKIVEEKMKACEEMQRKVDGIKVPIEEQKHYDLNELFDCRITDDCLHIHVIPKSVKEDMARAGGPTRYLNDVVAPNLDDALAKINDIITSSEKDINVIMAVSPTLRLGRKLFQERGFDVSETKEEPFKQMFGDTKIVKAVISRDKFLTMQEEKKNNNDLDAMFVNQKESKEDSKEAKKNTNKQLIKKDNSNQVGAASLSNIGLVLLIIIALITIIMISIIVLK